MLHLVYFNSPGCYLAIYTDDSLEERLSTYPPYELIESWSIPKKLATNIIYNLTTYHYTKVKNKRIKIAALSDPTSAINEMVHKGLTTLYITRASEDAEWKVELDKATGVIGYRRAIPTELAEHIKETLVIKELIPAILDIQKSLS